MMYSLRSKTKTAPAVDQLVHTIHEPAVRVADSDRIADALPLGQSTSFTWRAPVSRSTLRHSSIANLRALASVAQRDTMY